jgi:CRISPR-associated endonuclease/helicase Cas3
VITEDGLLALKKLLRQTATKNTAVSCHWIRGRRRSELLWVVGNRSKFNHEGVVPVNFTEQEILKKESFLPNTEVIAFLAAIAGYFHDVGKSNRLFQEKLGAIKNNEDTEAGKRYKKKYEPLRHEWISLRLFQAFVDQQTDQQWLQSLVDINHQTSEKLIHSLPNYQDLLTEDITNPFEYLPPIAKMVAWLIVSHHRLPQFPAKLDNQPNLDNIDDWQKIFEPCWNSSQAATEEWDLSVTQANWQFPLGTPFDSAFWQTNISTLAKRMLSSRNLFDNQWHDNLFTQHLARLALMLADHAESSKVEVDNSNSDRNFLVYANTDKDEQGNRYLKQKLDEHNIHVSNLAYSVACALPSLQSNLKTLDRVKALERPVPEKYKFDFGWQDKATKLAKEIKETVKTHGFFGISMASTGKGKTRANAKIMYALSEQDQCRFNVALGLRTLSIQTAKALKADLFGDDEKSQQQAQENIALLVGSQAVRDLQQINLAQENSTATDKGSESQESLLKDETVLLENLSIGLSEEYEWLAHEKKILRLLHAPILVSTIDYLMPATEGIRGGRQIAPMLRLLSSDLVLDEPDDFSSADFP